MQALALTWTAARDPLGKVAALNRGESYVQDISSARLAGDRSHALR